MSRKTIRVIDLLEEANKQLRRTDQWATKELKEGVIIMIESVLHATGNYQGFAFIDDNDSKTDTLGYFSRQYYTTLKSSNKEFWNRIHACNTQSSIV